VRTAILVPTFARYLPVARLTVTLLDRHWPDHPPIHVCGVTELPFGGAEGIPLRTDPLDWMGIVRDAVSTLRAEGYGLAYLLLDDHPPFAPCHGEHLRSTLPGWMEAFNATTIGLYGWDHRKDSSGRGLGGAHLHLQRQNPHYQWKFGLSPALWDLAVLEGILEKMGDAPSLKDRGPWRFESRSGRVDAPLPAAWKEGCYRVCGVAMRTRPVRWRDLAASASAYAAGRIYRQVRKGIERIGGVGALEWADRVYGWDDFFFEGPYPMYVNGIMHRGGVNRGLIRWLERTGRVALRAEIETAVAQVGAGPAAGGGKPCAA